MKTKPEPKSEKLTEELPEFARTQFALARILGCSRATICSHLKKPDSPKITDHGYPVKPWVEYMTRGNRTATQPKEIKSSRDRYWQAKAEMAEMESKEMRGDLIQKDHAQQVVTRAVMAAKSRLIGGQATLAAMIVASVGGDVLVVQEKIAARDREVLDLLSSGKWFKEEK